MIDLFEKVVNVTIILLERKNKFSNANQGGRQISILYTYWLFQLKLKGYDIYVLRYLNIW